MEIHTIFTDANGAYSIENSSKIIFILFEKLPLNIMNNHQMSKQKKIHQFIFTLRMKLTHSIIMVSIPTFSKRRLVSSAFACLASSLALTLTPTTNELTNTWAGQISTNLRFFWRRLAITFSRFLIQSKRKFSYDLG